MEMPIEVSLVSCMFFLFYVGAVNSMVSADAGGKESLPEKKVSVEAFGKYLDYLMNETLGVDKMQERINVLNFTRKRYDGGMLAKELSNKVSRTISLHVEGLKQIRKILEEEINSGGNKQSAQSKWTSCCRYQEEKTVFDKGFKTKIDDRDLCELISETTPLAFYSLPPTVLTTMRENRKTMPFMKWQYVGSNEGVFFTYPAHRRPDLCTGTHYDPRYRPWYVETASPKEKRVVIVLDTSNSMAQTHNSKRLIEIAIDAINTVMETLTPKDKIGIVAFNDTAYYPDDCFSKELAFADRINIRKLKHGFLRRLQPGGQSYYVKAFQAAFSLMNSSRNAESRFSQVRTELPTSHKCVILFISDGDASEIHRNKINEIYKTIREGNELIQNVATIFSYGLGRNVNTTLLEKIAKQEFDAELGPLSANTIDGKVPRNISQGNVYKIEEPSQLRNEISFFYTKLIKNDSDVENDKPSFSVPYVDQGGLGLIFTAGYPVFGKRPGRKFLAAVVAVDISISDLLSEIFKLRNDDRSYVFVIDGTGRVLVHPLMPHPDNDTPSFIRIDAFERENALKPVIESMMRGESGNHSLLSTRVAPAGDCNKVFIVNQTYHWHPIPNTNFSLCFVEEETDYEVSLSPDLSIYGCYDDMGNPRVMDQCENMTTSKFRYHRLDLSGVDDVCRHFYQMSIVETSVVKLAPQCFTDSEWYLQTSETAERVTTYERFFDDMLSLSSSEEARHVLRHHSVTKIIHPNVISDAIWTAYADPLWLSNSECHVIRRYIGTRTGMMRFYPGTNLSASYDPIERDWYELALAHPGIRVFSPPYKDAAGAGNVITISHTMTTPRIEKTPENEEVAKEKVIGVMGLDLSLSSFYSKLLKLYPNCTSRWHCILMDDRGYLVLHEDYTKTDAPERKHIIGEEGILSKILLKNEMMFRARCLEFESTKYKVSYVVEPNAFLNRMSDEYPKCSRYYMELIPNSNIFFIAREYHKSCYYYECTIKNQLCSKHTDCVIHDDWSTRTCECPCRANLEIDSCTSSVQAQIDIVACYPFRDRCDVVKADCIPDSLRPCNDPECEQQTDHMNCSSVVGCTWCQKTRTGSALKQPYCSDTDQCYNGFQDQSLPGFSAELKTCAIVKEEGNKGLIISISISVAVFVVVLSVIIFGCCYLHRQMDEKKRKLRMNGIDTPDEARRNDPVATIAAAIGAHDRIIGYSGSYSDGQSSCGDDHRHGSCSSQASYNRQRSTSSPQVVLSIVDSEGAEIARSLPRPVQIVRGNHGKSVVASKDIKLQSQSERQIRSTSTTSIVLGSAEESSGISSIANGAGVDRKNTKQRIKNGNVSQSCSGEGSAEAVIRKRILSASRRRNSTASSRGRTHRKHQSEPSTRDQTPSSGKERSFSEERPKLSKKCRPSKSFASKLITALRKRTPSKRSPQENENEEEDTDGIDEGIDPQIHDYSAFYNMFADPQNNECDIPIIQSDHSDTELPEHVATATSDYVSVCSESGRISGCSWLTSPRRRAGVGENFGKIEGEPNKERTTPKVFYDDSSDNTPSSFSVPDLSLEFPMSDYFKVDMSQFCQQQSHTSKQSTNGGDVQHEADARINTNPQRQTEYSSDQKGNVRSESLPQVSGTMKTHRKKDKTSTNRLKNMNTDNFIVYV